MAELRRRKLGKDKQHALAKNHPHTLHLKQVAQEKDVLLWKVLSWINFLVGLAVAIYVAFRYSNYAKELHENEMWFSNIKQVEREISFRTEAGLYFSYYKQMVEAPSISEGLRQLMHDNKTEHLRTINILNRFNIYQEVILGILYKVFHLERYLEYVYFYINTVFGLHGMYMMAIYFVSWFLSGTWLAGILGTLFYIFNKTDTTRLAFTIPLRESFSLPFVYAQLASITIFLKTDEQQRSKRFANCMEDDKLLNLTHELFQTSTLCLVVTAVSTLLTILTWQFAQFIILLESFALYGLWCLDFTSRKKVQSIYFIFAGCLIAACLMQFVNDMLLSSLALHFSMAAIFVLQLDRYFPDVQGMPKKIIKIVFLIVAVFSVTFVLNFGIKKLINVDSDEHIFKFVMAKLGYGNALKRDFDSLLYLCEGAFQYLPLDTFARLTEGIVFPCYVVAVAISLTILIASALLKWRNSGQQEHQSWMLHNYPEVAFTVIQTIFFGLMALSTLRMKFLWTPHICIVASGLFCHQDVWRWIFKKCNIEQAVARLFGYIIPFSLILLLLWKRLPDAMEELKGLREFYDPDTVELMIWINEKTPPRESFTGSMQLLAGVKLCTDRPITNHPHYENKFLRQRTKEVYQIYARKPASEVHRILKKHGSGYIILENSICYSRQKQGCRLTDILDIDNGDEIDNDPAKTKLNQVPRFCHAINFSSPVGHN
eukprot:gene566-1224_t